MASASSPALFEALPVAAALVDPAGLVVAVNDAFRTFVGATEYADAQSVVGSSYVAVCDGACGLSPSFAARLRDELDAVLRGERERCAVEDRAAAPEGAERRLRVVAQRVDDAVLVLHLDVTPVHERSAEQGRAQGELERMVRERTAELSRANVLLQYEIDERRRASAERNRLLDEVDLERRLLAAVLAQMPLGVMIVQGASGRLLLHNDELTRLVGAPRAGAISGVDAFAGAVLHPDGSPYAHDEHPLARALLGESVAGEEIEYERPDGSRVTLRASAVPVLDDDGAIAAAVLTLYDVSSWKAAERQLRESEMRYRLASRAINDAIWDWDLTAGRIEWSDGIFLRLGHPPSSVDPTVDWWLAQIHPLDRPRVREGIYAALGGTVESWRDEYRFRRFDGTWAHIVDRGFIVRDAERRALRAVGAMEDVTERRRAEAERAALLERERRARADAEAANRAKDEFLAVVSHELRTPLSPILGFVDVLREEGLEAREAATALDAIERNARTLKHLIDDLLDVARITSGKLSLEYAPLGLRDVVAAVLDSMRPAAEVKGLHLDVSLGAEEGMIAADGRRLMQVAANLISNAIKFTPRGGVVRVSVVRHGERVVLTVSDTGKGIAAQLLPHVFERFRQGDTSDTRVHGGLGLGLAIVRYIVDMHGGTILAQSPGEDRGATFTVSFPVLRREADP